MDVLIISDHDIDESESKSVLELLTRVHYIVEKDFSRAQEYLSKRTYKLIVFLTSKDAFPLAWNLNELKSKAAIVTMTKVDKLGLLIFSSFLKSVGLLANHSEKSREDDELPPVLYKSLAFIEENIHENDLSLEKVASNVYISRCHYSRMFKTFFGTGFKEYVMNKRIQKAKKMLQEGGSVTDVCYSVGYGDLTHFGRVFKRIVGINPSVYRKEHYRKVQNTG